MIEDRVIDLLDGELYAGDPEPVYAWLREEAPVYRDTVNDLWAVSRHADVLAVEKDPVRYSSAAGSRPKTDYRATMINKDDPQHQLQRKLVNREFTPKAVSRLEDRVREIVTALLDRVVAHGHADVVADIAAPLPVIVILDKLGYPLDIWPDASRWSETTMLSGGGPRYFTRAAMRSIEEFHALTHELVRARRAEPQDDLLSMWCHKVADDGSRMTDDEIVQEALLLLNGGADTTRTVISSGLLALLEHPDQLAAVVEDPGVFGATGVEELIRWVTPILNMRRTATEDHELHGCEIRAGDELLLLYSSANRDPAVFEDPQRFDVHRRHNQHVAFGFGTHFCLGASLARLEVRVAMEEIVRRLPDLRLQPWADPRIQPSAFTRGLKDLRVEFTPGEPEGRGLAAVVGA